MSRRARTVAAFSLFPSTRASGCLLPFSVNPDRGDRHEIVAEMQPVDLDHQKVERGQIGSHEVGQPRRRERDEPPRGRRLRLPDPGGAGTSPSGSRTARPNRRVDTLISIRFIAQRPSQSSSVAVSQLGIVTSRPSTPRTRGLDLDLARVEADPSSRSARRVASVARPAGIEGCTCPASYKRTASLDLSLSVRADRSDGHASVRSDRDWACRCRSRERRAHSPRVQVRQIAPRALGSDYPIGSPQLKRRDAQRGAAVRTSPLLSAAADCCTSMFIVFSGACPERSACAARVTIAGARARFPNRFAIRTLRGWYRDGIDASQQLPALSTYLDHACVPDTYWFLSACPELMEDTVRRLDRRWEAKP